MANIYYFNSILQIKNPKLMNYYVFTYTATKTKSSNIKHNLIKELIIPLSL
jgi:hypothetical protein